MPANVETFAYVSNSENNRFVPWHELGTKVDHAMTSKEALEFAGLNWKVEARPIFTDNGIQIPNYVANTRDSDDSVLGIVTNKYGIVQNEQAFEFTDNIVNGKDTRYETAGSLRGGKNVFLLARLPEERILGDVVEPFVVFSNTHDGTGAVKVALTPIRVVCQNTLSLALSSAKRTWTCKHMGKIEDKLAEAEHTLELAHRYMGALDTTCQNLANINVSDDEVRQVVQELFPVEEDDESRRAQNIREARQKFMVCVNMPDIAKFKGTALQLVNAMTDYVGHTEPQRVSPTFKERRFEQIVIGHPLLNQLMEKYAIATR